MWTIYFYLIYWKKKQKPRQKVDLNEFIQNQDRKHDCRHVKKPNTGAEIQFSLKLISCPPSPPLLTPSTGGAFALPYRPGRGRPTMTNKSKFPHLAISAVWFYGASLIAEGHCFWVDRRCFSAATDTVRRKWSCHGCITVLFFFFLSFFESSSSLRTTLLRYLLNTIIFLG